MDLKKKKLLADALTEAAAGDRDAVAYIYNAMKRSVYFIAYTITADAQHAENIAHDTFVTVIEKAASFKKGTNAVAWIMTIARNNALNFVKKNSRETAVGQLPEAAVSPGPENGAILGIMLETLDETDRQIIFMRVYEKMPHGDIGKILGITPGNSRIRYKRTLEKLKEFYR